MVAVMGEILLISSGLPSESSTSRRIAMALIDAIRDQIPDVSVTERFAATMPHPGNALVEAHGTPESSRTPEQAKLVAFHDEVVTEVERAKVLVITAPMHSLTIPSSVKAWIDYLNWKGRTYLPTADAREGMVTGRRVYVVITRAIAIAPDNPRNFQEPFLSAILDYYGLTGVEFITAEKTGKPEGADAIDQAMSTAKAAGRSTADWLTKEALA
jgi:FMN-dependent NADH-azoreductase